LVGLADLVSIRLTGWDDGEGEFELGLLFLGFIKITYDQRMGGKPRKTWVRLRGVGNNNFGLINV
jgi:hypothetical protein